jgi:hypothetical protein
MEDQMEFGRSTFASFQTSTPVDFGLLTGLKTDR